MAKSKNKKKRGRETDAAPTASVSAKKPKEAESGGGDAEESLQDLGASQQSQAEPQDGYDQEKAAQKTREGLATRRKVIVVIEEARLEVVRTSKGAYELINCDDHLNMHKKLNKDPADSRPDITHQCLLTLLDSPLNKAGHLQVYIQTREKVLIEISPHVRIPRTYKRFAGLIVQLLHKMRIKAADGKGTLLKVIKAPVTRHLPVNCRMFGTSVTGTSIDVQDFVQALPDEPVVFVFGGMAHGHLEPNYVEQMLSFSDYPLSAACAISRLMTAYERKWFIR